MGFLERIENTITQANEVAIVWLGQAGFLLKHAGKIIAIDPYLSDYAYDSLVHFFGQAFKRVSMPPCDAQELPFDAMLISHEHSDHLDLYSMRDFVRKDKPIYMTQACYEILSCEGMDTSNTIIKEKGDKISFNDVNIELVDSDHGEEAPTSVGFIIDYGFTRVYYAGDTAFNVERLQKVIRIKPEIALLPINGKFGNMNAIEAKEYAEMLGCKILIPYHFWTFPGQEGNPLELIKQYESGNSKTKLQILTPGEILLI